MKRTSLAVSVGISAILLARMPVFAQTVPNAGSLQRQLQDQSSPPAPLPAPIPPSPPPAASEGADQTLIDVKDFVIEGVSLVDPAEIREALAGLIGRSLGVSSLTAAIQAIPEIYRRHGYFARALLPPQEIANGIVHIRVIEGHFGEVLLVPGPDRADPDFVKRVVESDLVATEPYSFEQLEHGLMLANALPGIAATGTLQAGSRLGSSDLLLAVEDTPLLSGSVEADNAGAPTTGVHQASASLAINDPGGRGDQITLRTLDAVGLNYGQLGYSLPIGVSGWRLSLDASYLAYRLGSYFADLDAHGTAALADAGLSVPLVLSSRESLFAGLSLTYARYEDSSLGVSVDRKDRVAASLFLQGSRRDWSGEGVTRYGLSLSGGSLDLSGVATDAAEDRAGLRSAGGYLKTALQTGRDQPLGGGFVLRTRFSAQWAEKNLDPSEQFALGGIGGVRAYPSNEGLGDQGMLANLELHRPVTEGLLAGLDLYPLFDAGMIRIHQRPVGSGATSNVYTLYGAGVALAYDGPWGVSATGIFAVPVGPDQGAAQPGRNQDGSRRGERFLFTLSKSF